MSRYRFGASSTDLNQEAIVKALRNVGATVEILRHPVDLAVGYEGRTYLFEVKQPNGRVQPHQEDFIKGWKGDIAAIVRSATEALELIGAVQRSVSIGERVRAMAATSPWLTGESAE